jgi:hypothetical protein
MLSATAQRLYRVAAFLSLGLFVILNLAAGNPCTRKHIPFVPVPAASRRSRSCDHLRGDGIFSLRL